MKITNIKKIFSGKKKFLTIPISILLGLNVLPFVIGGLLAWLSYKKIDNIKLRFTTLAVITLITLFFGSAWVAGITSSNQPKPQAEQPQQTVQVDPNISQLTKPIEPSASPSVFKTQTAPNDPNIQLAKVTKVIDGDTIEVDLGEGNKKRVRYIGIDTPESVDPNQPVMCFSKEATAKNKELVENGIVGLEKDVSETDRYGRLLRYVYMGDLFINQTLVAEGYAHSSSYPPDIKHQDKFRQAEQQARTANRGLWGSCNTPTPIPTKKPTTTSSTNTPTKTNTSSGTSAGGACKYSCSSPDRDCSDFSSHAEAQAFFNCCGFSTSNDPMRLDRATGQGNGIACESLP
jgi:micrococcal nuclease